MHTLPDCIILAGSQALHYTVQWHSVQISYIFSFVQRLGIIAVVEDVGSRREPLPEMAGVYFITPSKDSVASLMEDFSDEPLYASGHVFFSSPAPQNVLAAIRSSPHLTSRLKTLKEVRTSWYITLYWRQLYLKCIASVHTLHSTGMPWLTCHPTLQGMHGLQASNCCTLNSAMWHVSISFYMQVNLEFQVRDERTYVTGEEDILQALLREKSSESPSYKLAVATLSSRLSGVFASLKVVRASWGC